jgi:AraC-like DNA-binding protein
MLLNEVKPSEHLEEFVRLYRVIDFQFEAGTAIPVKMYTPRPEQCIQFYPKDTETVSYPGTALSIVGKKTTLVGLHNGISHRSVGREFLSIQVVFHPGALFRITGIPMQELMNAYVDAEDIFNSDIRLVNEQLFHAGNYKEMVVIVEAFLSGIINRKTKTLDTLDYASKLMLSDESYELDKFTKYACLSHRQFSRKFKERIGIAPKQFLQLVRFDRAFRMKNRFPFKDWLTIALHCGYHDYQHLVKDYIRFTGYTPAQFFEIDSGSPERIFGDAEI